MRIIRNLLIGGCVAALPLVATAQTAANQTMGTNPQTTTTKTTTVHTEKHETKAEEKAETKTEMKAAHRTMKRTTKKTVATSHARVHEYSTRLGALLADTQGKATLSAASWKTIGNEANALANKLYSAASSNKEARKLATDARTHVRAMHAAALKGEDASARSHAAEALPFVHQLIEWSAPGSMAGMKM